MWKRIWGLGLVLAVGCVAEPVGSDSHAEEGALAFPQAISGGLWANPDVYPSIPVRVSAPGASAVTVTLQGTETAATALGDGLFKALVPIADLKDGPYEIVARAGDQELEATLGIGRQGAQLSDWFEVGRAGTPELHRVGDRLFMSFADRSEDGVSEIWLRELDGAGRWIGERIRIGHSPNETLDARVAVAGQRIGVLYQDLGNLPYQNFFQVTDLEGTIVYGPIKLDPPGLYGVKGGDITSDGTGFVVAWRLSAGGGAGEIRWMRVDAQSFATIGPKAIATASGNETFATNSPLAVEVVGGKSVVSYIKKKHSSAADFEIFRAHFATVSATGSVTGTEVVGSTTQWNEEAGVFRVGNELVPMWTSVDLNNPNQNPPTRFHGKRITATQTALSPTMFLSQPQVRSECAITGHPSKYAVATWLDQRTKDAGPDKGKIQLYAAPLSQSLSLGTSVVFDHAWFVQGTSALNATAAGDNVLLNWLDQRHGSGVFDPKPELYFETVWF